MILSDKTIKKYCQDFNMIEDFVEKQVSEHNNKKVISYGLGSYGYDARLSENFTQYKPSNKSSFNGQDIIDPKIPNDQIIDTFKTDKPIILQPQGFLLGLTKERFNIPRDVSVICIGKSTYARCGIIINVTPVEAGCSGHIVIEISNTAELPVYIYPNEGICQFLFFKGDQPCEISYADKRGKYLNQKHIVMPFTI
ncbi:MAG: dCTP deaminase [Rickettsiales bacterium]